MITIVGLAQRRVHADTAKEELFIMMISTTRTSRSLSRILFSLIFSGDGRLAGADHTVLSQLGAQA
jgi:hypothetical protein